MTQHPKNGPQTRSATGRKTGAALLDSPARVPSRGAMPTGGAGNRPQASGAARGSGVHASGTGGSAQKFGIDESNLATRRDFIRLGEEERQLLAGLIPWARSVAAQIAKEFYDWQFEFGPTRRFFDTYAQGAGMPISQLRPALERAQTGYFTQIFEGAEEYWGVSYFERRLKVGALHDKMNLPFKWYIGAYTEFQTVGQHPPARSLQGSGGGRGRGARHQQGFQLRHASHQRRVSDEYIRVDGTKS